jgi:hypothetical protein
LLEPELLRPLGVPIHAARGRSMLIEPSAVIALNALENRLIYH